MYYQVIGTFISSATCYGTKPAKGVNANVLPFNDMAWSMYDRVETFHYAPKGYSSGYSSQAEASAACTSIGARLATKNELDAALAMVCFELSISNVLYV